MPDSTTSIRAKYAAPKTAALEAVAAEAHNVASANLALDEAIKAAVGVGVSKTAIARRVGKTRAWVDSRLVGWPSQRKQRNSKGAKQ